MAVLASGGGLRVHNVEKIAQIAFTTIQKNARENSAEKPAAQPLT